MCHYHYELSDELMPLKDMFPREFDLIDDELKSKKCKLLKLYQWIKMVYHRQQKNVTPTGVRLSEKLQHSD